MQGVSFHRQWEARADGEVTCISLARHGGRCVVGTSSGQLIFFESDGDILWQSSLDGSVRGVRCGYRGEHAVALNDSLLMAAYNSVGETLWIKELPFMADCFDLRPGSNMIVVGNRYGHFRFVTIHGKLMPGGELKHAIDYVRFSPTGGNCAMACEDGHISLVGSRQQVRWTVFLHRTILGLDVAEKAQFIIAPSGNQGVVALDEDGQGVGVYELKKPIMAAMVNDPGNNIILLDHNGELIVLDREANLLFLKPCFDKASAGCETLDKGKGVNSLSLATRSKLLDVDSDGDRILVSGSGGRVECYRRSDLGVAASEFVEVSMKKGAFHHEKDDPVGYLEV